MGSQNTNIIDLLTQPSHNGKLETVKTYIPLLGVRRSEMLRNFENVKIEPRSMKNEDLASFFL